MWVELIAYESQALAHCFHLVEMRNCVDLKIENPIEAIIWVTHFVFLFFCSVIQVILFNSAHKDFEQSCLFHYIYIIFWLAWVRCTEIEK